MTLRKKPVSSNMQEQIDVTPAKSARSTRVCLVTTEFHGLFKNGGIGTANTGLAFALLGAGFDVTVAFADADQHGPRVKGCNFSELQDQYRELGISLDFVPANPLIAAAFDDPRSAGYCVYLYLKQHAFDVVYFNDCGGLGYFSLLAKRTGVFLNAPRMYVVAHGPHEWVLELNSLRYWSRTPVISAFLERRSAALADALVSPSRYLLDWMRSREWSLPENALVMQNIVRLPESAAPSIRTRQADRISEIVFFGRLEVRKGIELFCDAIDRLNQSIDLSGIRITFLGKFSHVAGLHSGMYVVERARRWQSSLRLLSTYGQEEALCYLNRRGMLAVIPSHAENSPCVVAECLQLGVPFLASSRGGTAELVAPEDREFCLFPPTDEALAARLARILESGQGPARLAVSQSDSLAQWVRLTESGPGAAGFPSQRIDAQTESAAALPLVSVCLTSSILSPESGDLLQSLLLQEHANLELILADDGLNLSAEKEISAQSVPVRVVRETGSDRGGQRNAAAAAASGEFLLFVDESRVILLPGCVDALITAALLTGADIVTAIPFQTRSRFAGAREDTLGYFPIGGCAELGGLENCFGEGVFLIRRRQFAAGGGFQTSCHAEIEDWLFLAASVLDGLSLAVVPEPLYRSRMRRPEGLDHPKTVDNQRRILHAYRGQKIEMFKHVLESVAYLHSPYQERARGVVEGLSGQAREIALRISSSVEPNSEQALRGFAQFCVERQKFDEALDFALHNDRSLLADALDSAGTVAQALTLDTVRRHPLEAWHEVVLTNEVRERITSVSAFPAQALAPLSNGIAAHALEIGITILKASAVCPPGTRFVRAAARIEGPAQVSLSLALVVATPDARLRLSPQGLESSELFWWSQWITAGNGRVDLQVPVKEPAEALLDLHFLCKLDDDGGRPEGKLLWESAAATLAINGLMTASVIEEFEPGTPIARQVIDQGVLLTESPDFPFPVFVPGEPTLLHPLPRRAALVRLPGAVPPGVTGVRSVVSIDLAEAHPVQFAVWLRPSSMPATSEAELTPAYAFSGWFSVRDTFRQHSFTLTLDQPAAETMDLYMATRVVEFPDVYYCHAVWHQLLLLD